MRQVAFAVWAVSLAWGVPAAARNCDRACTLQVVDAVLTALQTGQFGTLLPRSVRVTENGRDIRPADSQFRALKKVTYQHAFAEPPGGVAGLNGAADAYGGAAVFSMRLKLKGDQVTEIETLVVRRTEALMFSPETLVRTSDRDQILPPERRASGPDLMVITDAWLDGVTQGQTDGMPSTPDCKLTENGARSASCRSITSLRGVTLIRDRRWPLVDDTRGLVWVFAVADIAETTGVAVGRPANRSARRPPHSVRIAALFRVKPSRISAVDLVLRDAPAGALTGWAPPKVRKSPAFESRAVVTDGR